MNVQDIMIVAANWHSPNPDPRTDLDGDVDVVDVMQANAEWGQACPTASPPA